MQVVSLPLWSAHYSAFTPTLSEYLPYLLLLVSLTLDNETQLPLKNRNYSLKAYTVVYILETFAYAYRNDLYRPNNKKLLPLCHKLSFYLNDTTVLPYDHAYDHVSSSYPLFLIACYFHHPLCCRPFVKYMNPILFLLYSSSTLCVLRCTLMCCFRIPPLLSC